MGIPSYQPHQNTSESGLISTESMQCKANIGMDLNVGKMTRKMQDWDVGKKNWIKRYGAIALIKIQEKPTWAIDSVQVHCLRSMIFL